MAAGARYTVAIAASYPEGAVAAIAREAAHTDRLERFYTTLYAPAVRRWTRPLPQCVRTVAEGLVARRAFAGIPPERVETVARVQAFAGIAARRLPLSRRLAMQAMYGSARAFDRSVARRLGSGGQDAVLAVYAAAELSFRSARQRGQLTVLHFVNSHPSFQNRVLAEFAGVGPGHQEHVPRRVAQRVDAELARADCVLVPSEFVARQLREQGVAPEAIAVVPYGVDLKAFRARDEARAGERRQGPLRCLFVGQVGHRKGVTFLLDAARALGGEATFRLVGPVTSAEVVRELPANATWSGESGHAAVAEAMRDADVLVLPSLEDSYGLVVLEAMASSLPVVVSTHTGASEAVADGQTGFVVPAGDAAALAAVLSRLAAEPGLASRVGHAARRAVEATASWEGYGVRVLDLVGERLSARRG